MGTEAASQNAIGSSSLAFKPNELVRWGGRGGEPVRYGLVTGETAGGLRALTVCLAHRDAFDLVRVHIPWTETIEALGPGDLGQVFEQAWIHSTDETLTGEREMELVEEYRPLDQLELGGLVRIGRHPEIMDLLLRQLAETKDRRLRTLRTNRLFGLLCRTDTPTSAWWVLVIRLLRSVRIENGDLFRAVRGSDAMRRLVIKRVYLRLLVCRQGGRRYYLDFIKRRLAPIMKTEENVSPETRIHQELHPYDPKRNLLLHEIVDLLKSDGVGFHDADALALIDPGTWSPAIWNALVKPLRAMKETLDPQQVLHDHADMPYLETLRATLAKARPDLVKAMDA